MWEDVLLSIVDVLLPAVLALLGALLAYGVAYVRTRTEAIKDERLRKAANDVIDRAHQEVYASVQYVAQTYVDDLKAAKEDGKLTNEEKAEALSRAKQAFKTRMGQHALEQLAAVVGDIEEWIRTQIEASIHDSGSALIAKNSVGSVGS